MKNRTEIRAMFITEFQRSPTTDELDRYWKSLISRRLEYNSEYFAVNRTWPSKEQRARDKVF